MSRGEHHDHDREHLSFQEAVAQIAQHDPRYPAEAYFFVRDGLDDTVKRLKKGARGVMRHVTGKELSEGLCAFAIEEYGPMARFTLAAWGLHRTEDFGEVVFKLIEAGRLGKTANDRKEDFAGLFDLAAELSAPFAVEEPPPPMRPIHRPRPQ